MKKCMLLGGFVLCFLSMMAEDITLLNVKEPGKKNQQEIPVHTDMNNSLLGIHFLDEVDVTITVVGPEGVVYQKEVTTPFPESVYVDLNPYQNGAYTIYIKDREGNLLWGDFMK